MGSVKAFLILFVAVPRFLIAAVLLVVGCRWLSATTNFEELFLNSLGLAFILELKEIVYSSLTPLKTKRDLLLTKMKPMNDRLSLSMGQALRGFPAFGCNLLLGLVVHVPFAACAPVVCVGRAA